MCERPLLLSLSFGNLVRQPQERAKLIEGDISCHADVSHQSDELEGEVCGGLLLLLLAMLPCRFVRHDGQELEKRVDDMRQDFGEARPGHEEQLEAKHDGEKCPPPPLSMAQISQRGKEVHARRAGEVVGNLQSQAVRHEVPDGNQPLTLAAQLPRVDDGAEALVREPLGRISQRLCRLLENDEEVMTAVQLSVGRQPGGSLVRVVQGGEATQAGLYLPLGCGGRKREELVVVWLARAQDVVSLIDGVGEVERHDEDLNAAAVARVGRRARVRLGRAGADGYTVVDLL